VDCYVTTLQLLLHKATIPFCCVIIVIKPHRLPTSFSLSVSSVTHTFSLFSVRLPTSVVGVNLTSVFTVDAGDRSSDLWGLGFAMVIADVIAYIWICVAFWICVAYDVRSFVECCYICGFLLSVMPF